MAVVVALAAAGLVGCSDSTPAGDVPLAASTAEPAAPASGLGEAPAVPPPTGQAAEPIQVFYGDHADTVASLTLPASPAPASGFPLVVVVHGGFWQQQFDRTLMDDLAIDLARRGYGAWNVEYRRIAGGDGGWPRTGLDVVAAIEFVDELAALYPVDVDRVVTVGHSAGAHLALWARGYEEMVDVLGSIGLGAVVDPAQFRQAAPLFGGSPEELPADYADATPAFDPDALARTPVVLVQGAADTIVPTETLVPATDAGVPLVLIDGDDHFDLIDPDSDSWAATLEQITNFFVSPS